MGNYRGGASACNFACQMVTTVEDGDAKPTPNITARALCRSILITNKSLLGLIGTNTVKNENLVIIYILTSISIASS